MDGQDQQQPPEDEANIEDLQEDLEEWSRPPAAPTQPEQQSMMPCATAVSSSNGDGKKVFEANFESLIGDDERQCAGGIVIVHFVFSPAELNLNNGVPFIRKFFTGQTVAYMKQQLEDLFEIPFHRMALLHNGRLLLDPLSLTDMPNIFCPGGEVGVEVRIT